jgi:uracil phosphoribosyltransferase
VQTCLLGAEHPVAGIAQARHDVAVIVEPLVDGGGPDRHVGMLDLIPSARVGHIGLYRDHKTLEPVEYYFKVPYSMAERDCIIVDPMLATGNSAAAAVARIKKTGPRSIKFVCLLTVPEGLKVFHDAHPDVPVYTAAIDERLNEKSYIVPGLGDAGDRMFGTK